MDCDVSLFDTAISMLTYPAVWNLNGSFEPTRTRHSAHPSLIPFQAFPTQDGWVVVACPKEKFWRRLAVAVGEPALSQDPRFATFALRRANADELLATLEDLFAARTTEEWLATLRTAGVPCGPVNSVAAALADEQTIARGLVVSTDHPRFGVVRQVRSPVQIGSEPVEYQRAPARNEHADLVLKTLLGYDDATVDALARGGAFGGPDE